MKDKKRHSTFAVYFYINKHKIKKNGRCTIMGRISINAGIARFSTKIDIQPDAWDVKNGKVNGKKRQTTKINPTLDLLARKISFHYEDILEKQGYVTAELVKNVLNGIGEKPDTLLKLFAEHNEEFKSRIGINRVKTTYYLYTLSYRHLAAFIRQKYTTNDIALRKLNPSFIDAYDFYLRIEKQMAQNSIAIHIIILKKMIKRAIRQGTLKSNPFYAYALEQPEKKCRHLKADDIEKIMQVHIPSKRVCHTRDMFVFSCFTGLAYRDLRNLSEKHLQTGEDGGKWLCFKRQKTNTICNVRLLEIPRLIIEKYRNERKSDKLFNTVTFSCLSDNLKKISQLCRIEPITFHQARHNFGTHITLSQGVPIETVSKMMGHHSITTTQIYAKITNQKVNEDMKQLAERLTGRYTVFEDAKEAR
ncbi:tyrosine recombinase [Bacteroidia bacterium]|nr:tyrosine recombinase [Bacteroidia bacterium]GHU84259.1 tyrosine recombinase [Bacteroidia bacterium]GHV71489.1 tyrosine recombinase [Bacteroidia bacterium]